MDRLHLSLLKDELEEGREEAEKNAVKEYDEELGKQYLVFSEELDIQEFTIKENSIYLRGEFGLGNVSVEFHLNDDELIKLIEYAVKKLNKYKSFIETIKSI